jgi:hypothetical protein
MKGKDKMKISQGLIRPFNLDPSEHEAMYNGPLPEDLAAVLIITFYKDWEDLKHQTSELALAAYPKSLDQFLFAEPDTDDPLVCALNSRACGLECDIEISVYHDMWPCVGGVRPSDTFDAWEIQRAQLQLAFVNRLQDVCNMPINTLTCSMRVFDHLWDKTRSVEAKDHRPLQVKSEEAERFQLLVGDIYRQRWGFMNRKLIDYRNKVLVMFRALVAGQDPIAEYNRFINAGGKYYAEYPTLCPNPHQTEAESGHNDKQLTKERSQNGIKPNGID